ncbi:hypothetical protein ABMA28_008985 [Loxostege sticticalis]|uniref:BESS domain-containing protein n=1 Tax=Loxostege sticticalis TaxID=481309 RepID=A0ABD0SFD8_LOXSC
MSEMAFFNPADLIEEIQKRPALYKSDQPAEREEKLALWKEVGAAIFSDWETYNKATAYDKVLQLQRKWRSLRDAYNRELRSRRTGIRTNRKVYKYFKKMSFLGGFTGTLSEDENVADVTETHSTTADDDLSVSDAAIVKSLAVREPKVKVKKQRKKQRKRRSTIDSDPPPEEVEMPMFSLEVANDSENDSDRLFLLSFLPEMRQLPLNLKMWVRAQIASVMQEAVTCHYSNTLPGTSAEKNGLDVKRPRYDSNEDS